MPFFCSSKIAALMKLLVNRYQAYNSSLYNLSLESET